MPELTDSQKHLVQASFRTLAADFDITAAIFYGHLFTQDPTLPGLFHTDMESQGRKLMETLAVLVNGLDDLPALIGPIQVLAQHHLGYGVRREHFRMAEASLLHTLVQVLGDAYTDDIGASWQATYRIVESVIVDSAYAD
ncbi:MAG: hemin receptor [Anaerolineaceae bacterium]|nr:hemin receptor [Anaerolineaceae bacterium]